MVLNMDIGNNIFLNVMKTNLIWNSILLDMKLKLFQIFVLHAHIFKTNEIGQVKLLKYF